MAAVVVVEVACANCRSRMPVTFRCGRVKPDGTVVIRADPLDVHLLDLFVDSHVGPVAATTIAVGD